MAGRNKGQEYNLPRLLLLTFSACESAPVPFCNTETREVSRLTLGHGSFTLLRGERLPHRSSRVNGIGLPQCPFLISPLLWLLVCVPWIIAIELQAAGRTRWLSFRHAAVVPLEEGACLSPCRLPVEAAILRAR